jgi:protocatechuate 3,4-dioxygenase beta subunit
MWVGSPSGTTDAEGRYRLDGVPAEAHGVLAVAPGYAPTDAQSDAMKVEVAADAREPVEKDVALTQAGRVVGFVKDSKGEPVAGARVRSRAAPAPSSGESRGGRGGPPNMAGRIAGLLPGGSAADLTDQDGRFVLEGLASDRRWVVAAEADDFVDAESEAFELKAGEEKEVTVTMTGGGGVSGRVVDDYGHWVAGARVRVGRLPADAVGRPRLSAWEVDRYLEPRTVTTDGEGRFLVEDVPPGIAVVRVELEGYVTHYKRGLVIRADEVLENHVVTLTKGEVLEGKVLSEAGRPIQAAIVAVTQSDDPAMGGGAADAEPSDEIEPRMTARTDADGKFKVENVPPGTWNVVVWFAPGHVGWGGARAEPAMRRGVDAASKTVEFRLPADLQPQGPGAVPRPPR